MIRKAMGTMAVLVTMAVSVQPLAGQGIELGYTDVGPTVGLGGIGSASLAIGGRFERIIREVPDLGNGHIGIQAGADYYSYSTGFVGGDYSLTYIPIGVTGNYHFNLENNRVDPFLGLGLGYSIISCDWPGSGFDPCASSAIYFIGRAGIRYFMSNSLALYADAGAGAATLNVGAMFRIN